MTSDEYITQEFAITVKGGSKATLLAAREFILEPRLIGPVHHENGTTHARIWARWCQLADWFAASLVSESEGLEFPDGTLLWAGQPSAVDRRGDWQRMEVPNA
jgi:hypothetical protein